MSDSSIVIIQGTVGLYTVATRCHTCFAVTLKYTEDSSLTILRHSLTRLLCLWMICLDYLLANWETFVHTSTQKIPKRKKSITKEESMNQLLVYFVIQCKIAAKSSEVNILCWREYREFCIKQKKYWIYSCFLFEKETNGIK